MTYQQAYKTHHTRIVTEKIIESFIISLLIGLGAAAIIAIATMFTDFYGLWTSIGVFAGLTVALTPVFYFAKFRPDEKTVAEKLDRMGFDERVITMLELEGDQSEIAKIQRNDAIAVITAVAAANGGKIAAKGASAKTKLAAVGLSTKMIIIASVVAVVAITSFILTGLPKATVRELFVSKPIYTVSINAGDRGYFSDANFFTDANDQSVKVVQFSVEQGKSSPAVVINAKSQRWVDEMGEAQENRYFFVGWDDGYIGDELNLATRTDINVRGAYKANALYGEVAMVVGDNPDRAGSGSGDSDDNNGSEDDRPPKDSESNSSNSMNPPPSQDPSNSRGDYDIDKNDEVINGETSYKEIYQDYYDLAMEMLAKGEEIPTGLRNIIATYFGILL